MDARGETVAEFAQCILADIQAVPPNATGTVFVRVESSLLIERLTEFLKSLTTIHLLSSADSLQTLKNFLRDRWKTIQKTDAIYSIHPDTQINQVCIRLAQKLSRYYPLHPFELLMPTAAGFMNYFPRHTSDSVKLNEFILRDNGQPISVLDAFFLLEHAITPSPCFDQYQHVAGTRKLSLEEELLLSNHSDAAKKYYSVLCNRASQPIDKQTAKAALISFMASMDKSAETKSTYDVVGNIRLARLVLELVGDRKKLVALFAHTIPMSEWRIFQALISDDDYFRYMGGVDLQKRPTESVSDFNAHRFKQVEISLKMLLMPPSVQASAELKDILVVVGDIGHKIAALRAYAFCLLELYRRVRKLQPESPSVVGSYMSSLFKGYSYSCSKEEKLNACQAIEAILIESPSLTALLSALEGESMQSHQKAIQDGHLGGYLGIIKNIIERACSLEDPSRQRDWVRTYA